MIEKDVSYCDMSFFYWHSIGLYDKLTETRWHVTLHAANQRNIRSINMINYWIKAYKSPNLIMSIVSRKTDKMRIMMSMQLTLGALLLASSLIRYLTNFEGYYPYLLNVDTSRYYLVQSIYAIPFVLLTWILSSGVLYMLSVFGKAASRRYFLDDALVIMTFATALPWFLIVWMPNVLIYPVTGVLMGDIGELVRCIVIPYLWQTFLVSVGVHEIFQVKWKRSIWIAMITSLVYIGMVLIFIR